jgi:ribonuclease III
MSHPKSELVERAQRHGLGKPKYRTRNEGSAHEPVFKTEVILGGAVIGRGEGNQKRQAERLAAETALAFLEERGDRLESTASAAPSPESFEGPWPIFESVLAASLHVANSRVDPDASGAEAVETVRDLALTLYKDMLEHLGEVVEIEE